MDLLHKQVWAGRHHKGEAPGPAACQLGRSYMRLKGVSRDRLLDAAHRLRPHARAVVEDPVHGGEAHPGLACDPLERQRRVVLLHGATLAEAL